MKFRFKDDDYKYPENLTMSWDMIEKDVERETKLNFDFKPVILKPLPPEYWLITPEPIKPWWKFWIK